MRDWVATQLQDSPVDVAQRVRTFLDSRGFLEGPADGSVVRFERGAPYVSFIAPSPKMFRTSFDVDLRASEGGTMVSVASEVQATGQAVSGPDLAFLDAELEAVLDAASGRPVDGAMLDRMAGRLIMMNVLLTGSLIVGLIAIAILILAFSLDVVTLVIVWLGYFVFWMIAVVAGAVISRRVVKGRRATRREKMPTRLGSWT